MKVTKELVDLLCRCSHWKSCDLTLLLGLSVEEARDIISTLHRRRHIYLDYNPKGYRLTADGIDWVKMYRDKFEKEESNGKQARNIFFRR